MVSGMWPIRVCWPKDAQSRNLASYTPVIRVYISIDGFPIEGEMTVPNCKHRGVLLDRKGPFSKRSRWHVQRDLEVWRALVVFRLGDTLNALVSHWSGHVCESTMYSPKFRRLPAVAACVPYWSRHRASAMIMWGYDRGCPGGVLFGCWEVRDDGTRLQLGHLRIRDVSCYFAVLCLQCIIKLEFGSTPNSPKNLIPLQPSTCSSWQCWKLQD